MAYADDAGRTMTWPNDLKSARPYGRNYLKPHKEKISKWDIMKREAMRRIVRRRATILPISSLSERSVRRDPQKILL